MIRLKNLMHLILGCLLCLILGGCVSSKYVEQKQYLLSIKTLPEKKMMHNKCLVFVDHVTAIAPFDQLDFLYRIKSGQYLTDYYHGFLVSPTEQLDPILINYLRALGDFDLYTTGLITVSNKLQVQITEFYADYRDNAHPQAVIGLRFILTRGVDNKIVVLFDKTLYGKISLKEKNATSLLVAWNAGLQDVLRRGVRDLNLVLSNNACVNLQTEQKT